MPKTGGSSPSPGPIRSPSRLPLAAHLSTSHPPTLPAPLTETPLLKQHTGFLVSTDEVQNPDHFPPLHGPHCPASLGPDAPTSSSLGLCFALPSGCSHCLPLVYRTKFQNFQSPTSIPLPQGTCLRSSRLWTHGVRRHRSGWGSTPPPPLSGWGAPGSVSQMASACHLPPAGICPFKDAQPHNGLLS